jgi:hypothetical protein
LTGKKAELVHKALRVIDYRIIAKYVGDVQEWVGENLPNGM